MPIVNTKELDAVHEALLVNEGLRQAAAREVIDADKVFQMVHSRFNEKYNKLAKGDSLFSEET